MKHFSFLYLFAVLLVMLSGCISSETPIDNDSNNDDFHDIEVGKYNINSTVLSPDGTMIAVNVSSAVKIFDTKTSMLLCEFSSQSDTIVEAVNFSDDGSKLLINSSSILIVNPRNGKVIQKFESARIARMLGDGSAIVVCKELSSLTTPLKLSLHSITNGLKINDFSFNETDEWIFLGVAESKKLVLSRFDKGYGSVRIIYWDIISDLKLTDVTIPNIYHENIYNYSVSPNLEVIGLTIDTSFKKFNFYNTKTGVKINKSPFSFRKDTKRAYQFNGIPIANDFTFTAEEVSPGNYPPTSLISYRIQDLELKKN